MTTHYATAAIRNVGGVHQYNSESSTSEYHAEIPVDAELKEFELPFMPKYLCYENIGKEGWIVVGADGGWMSHLEPGESDKISPAGWQTLTLTAEMASNLKIIAVPK
jgi:hypothetical protein